MLTLSSATITAALSRLRTTAARVVVAGTVALSVALIQVPPLAGALHLEPLHRDDWLIASAGSLFVALIPWLYEQLHSQVTAERPDGSALTSRRLAPASGVPADATATRSDNSSIPS